MNYYNTKPYSGTPLYVGGNQNNPQQQTPPTNINYQQMALPSEQSYIENILRQMPFLNLMPTGNIKLADVIAYLNAGATAVAVGRDFYQGFTPNEITARTKEIITEVKDFTKWNQK